MWNTISNQAAWLTRKIFNAKETLGKAGFIYADIMNMDSFSIRQVYQMLREQYQKIVCSNAGCPNEFLIGLWLRMEDYKLGIGWQNGASQITLSVLYVRVVRNPLRTYFSAANIQQTCGRNS